MILSIFAKGVGGGTLGFLNSARFAGDAAGLFLGDFHSGLLEPSRFYISSFPP